jgi:hypothetical protein
MMNSNGYGSKRLWPNFRYHCLEGLRKITEHLSQDSRSLFRDLNPRLPEYEAGLSCCEELCRYIPVNLKDVIFTLNKR